MPLSLICGQELVKDGDFGYCLKLACLRGVGSVSFLQVTEANKVEHETIYSQGEGEFRFLDKMLTK